MILNISDIIVAPSVTRFTGWGRDGHDRPGTMVALCFAHGGRSMPEKGCSVGLHWAELWPKVVRYSLGTPQRGVLDPMLLTDRTDGRENSDSCVKITTCCYYAQL